MRSFFTFSVLAIFCIATACHSKPKSPSTPPAGVTAFQVEPQTIPALFDFIGVAKSSHPVEIRSRVEGYLKSIDYIEGSMVDCNTLLFTIDPRQFEASVDEAKGVLAKEEAILWRSQKSYERLEPLFKKNAVSERDLDNAIAAVFAGEASVISAKANLVKANLNLSYTYITSPVKGLVGKAIYREGTLITPSINGLLTYVSIIDPIWIYFTISDYELLIARSESTQQRLTLPKEQDFDVFLELADGSQFSFTGKVNFKSPTLDPETGTLMVRATFPNPKGEILPGQFVRAKVKGALRPNAILVPQKSVFQGNKGMYVFVIGPDDKVSQRSVEVGDWYKDYWIIKSGLEPGEMVIADGVNKVLPGATVKVLSIEKPDVIKERDTL